MLSPEYVAGLFDGEGCVCLSYIRRRPWRSNPAKAVYGFKLAVMVSNTYRPIMEQLHAEHPGVMFMGNPRKARLHYRPVWNWRLNAADPQRRFLSWIQPHAIIKAEQIALALAYLDTAVLPGHRIPQDHWERRCEVFARFSELNQRGASRPKKWPIPPAAPTGLKPSRFYSRPELLERMAKVRTAKLAA